MEVKYSLHILVGLPGSGKSNYAYKSSEKDNSLILDLDQTYEKRFWRKDITLDKAVGYAISDLNRPGTSYILDGLFLSQEDVLKAILSFERYIKTDYLQQIITVYIHQWNEDRKTCERNDEGRRGSPSIGMIRNAKYLLVDLDKLQEDLKECKNITVHPHLINHTVELKPEWQRLYGQKIGNDGILRSQKYVTGGAIGNCWNDSIFCVDGEEIKPFFELYDFLEEAVPHLTLKDWKKIEPEVVSQRSWRESEYYNGWTGYVQWECDIQKLYDLLDEYDIVTKKEE